MVDLPVGIAQKLRAIWHCDKEDNDYSAEVSTLKSNLGEFYSFCPKCMRPYNGTHVVKTDWNSTHEDICGWNFVHACGAKLLVVND